MISPATLSEDPALLALPFDHYQRYQITARLISNLINPKPVDRPLSSLDVGGAGSSLKHFLPDNFVVVSDPAAPLSEGHVSGVPPAYDYYVMATGTSLPFADSTFDAVVACDTLEHLPAEERESFIVELLRVARGLCVINGPCASATALHDESTIAGLFERLMGWQHPFLKEHRDFGLPSRESIEEVLRGRQVPYAVLGNGASRMWVLMMALRYCLTALSYSPPLQEAVDRAYNVYVSPRDFAQDAYRQAFVIAKDPVDYELVQTVVQELSNPESDQTVPGNAIDSLIAAMEHHTAAIKGELDGLAERTRAQEAEIARLQEAESSWRANAAEWRSKQAETRQELDGTEQRLAETVADLEAIHSSSGYRILTGARTKARSWFPEGTTRGKVYRRLLRPVSRFLERRWPA